MLRGAHFLIYSRDADADRRFLEETLALQSVDAGRGWLIFKLPPSEVAVHPSDDTSSTVNSGHALMTSILYWLCDDLDETMKTLGERGVQFTEVGQERWGKRTTMVLPSGGELGLYQPFHPLALDLP